MPSTSHSYAPPISYTLDTHCSTLYSTSGDKVNTDKVSNTVKGSGKTITAKKDDKKVDKSTTKNKDKDKEKEKNKDVDKEKDKEGLGGIKTSVGGKCQRDSFYPWGLFSLDLSTFCDRSVAYELLGLATMKRGCKGSLLLL